MSWNFSAGVGRLACVAALGLFSLSLVPAAGVNAAERPLDFGAALLMPADVAQFGFENYGIDSGRYFSIQQMVAEGSSVDATDPAFDEVGMESVHNLMLHPIGGIVEDPGPDINITSFIYVYEDEELAEAGFALFEDESDDPMAADLDDAPALGDESELTEYVGEFTENGETYDLHELAYSFRIGRVVASVAAAGFNDEVNRDDVEAMGAFFETKVLGVLMDGEIGGYRTPGLDSVAPRYEAEDIAASRSHYCVLNGEALMEAYAPDHQESLQQWVDDYDVIASYCSIARLWLADAEGSDLLLIVQPTGFSQAGEAARYVADEADSATGPDSGFDGLEVIDIEPGDLPFEVDSVLAMTYEYEYNGATRYETKLTVQQGRLVIELRLNGLSAPNLDVLITVMADALGCADTACYETSDAPSALTDFMDEQRDLWAEQ